MFTKSSILVKYINMQMFDYKAQKQKEQLILMERSLFLKVFGLNKCMQQILCQPTEQHRLLLSTTEGKKQSGN